MKMYGCILRNRLRKKFNHFITFHVKNIFGHTAQEFVIIAINEKVICILILKCNLLV